MRIVNLNQVPRSHQPGRRHNPTRPHTLDTSTSRETQVGRWWGASTRRGPRQTVRTVIHAPTCPDNPRDCNGKIRPFTVDLASNRSAASANADRPPSSNLEGLRPSSLPQSGKNWRNGARRLVEAERTVQALSFNSQYSVVRCRSTVTNRQGPLISRKRSLSGRNHIPTERKKPRQAVFWDVNKQRGDCPQSPPPVQHHTEAAIAAAHTGSQSRSHSLY